MKRYLPSVIGMSCITCSRQLNEIKPTWVAPFEEMLGKPWEEIEQCHKELWAYYEQTFTKFKKKIPSPETVHLPTISSNNTSINEQVTEFKADIGS